MTLATAKITTIHDDMALGTEILELAKQGHVGLRCEDEPRNLEHP